MSRTPRRRIPFPLASIVGEALGGWYFRHHEIEMLFLRHGAPEPIPEGSCVAKVKQWLLDAEDNPTCDELALLGSVLEEFMEAPNGSLHMEFAYAREKRRHVADLLARYNLRYERGRVLGSVTRVAATRSVEDLISESDLDALDDEYRRAHSQAHSDPASAITAACALVEAALWHSIRELQLQPGKKKDVQALWNTVRPALQMGPDQHTGDDLKQILSGLIAVVGGIGAVRTHGGSAHGRQTSLRRQWNVRHAYLAINASHTFVDFLLRTLAERQATEDGTTKGER